MSKTIEIDYRFNGETRRLPATPGICNGCKTQVLWVKVSWNVFHSVDPVTHKGHYSECPQRAEEREVYRKWKEQAERQLPRSATAFEQTQACEMMDCRDGWDDDDYDW